MWLYDLGPFGVLILGVAPILAALGLLTLIEEDEKKKVDALRLFVSYAALFLFLMAWTVRPLW